MIEIAAENLILGWTSQKNMMIEEAGTSVQPEEIHTQPQSMQPQSCDRLE